jgi:hypothetical protein
VRVGLQGSAMSHIMAGGETRTTVRSMQWAEGGKWQGW